MNKLDNVILYASGSRGQYIPQHFAETIQRHLVHGVSDEDWEVLEAGPEHEWYWETWENVINSAYISDKESVKPRIHHLHHDGDLWLLDYENMTREESENFDIDYFGDDEENDDA